MTWYLAFQFNNRMCKKSGLIIAVFSYWSFLFRISVAFLDNTLSPFVFCFSFSKLRSLLQMLSLVSEITYIVYSDIFLCLFPFSILTFLGAFEKVRKVSFVMSVRSSVCPHGRTWLPLDRFWWELIFRLFSKIEFKFHQALTRVMGTLLEDSFTFITISR
jgi:hypothetical protein